MFFGDYYIKLEHAFFNLNNKNIKSRMALNSSLELIKDVKNFEINLSRKYTMLFRCKLCNKPLPTSSLICDRCGCRDFKSKRTRPFITVEYVDKNGNALPPSTHYFTGILDPIWEGSLSHRHHSDGIMKRTHHSRGTNSTLEWSVKFRAEVKTDFCLETFKSKTKDVTVSVSFKCNRFSDSTQIIEIICDYELERVGNNVNVLVARSGGSPNRYGVGLANILYSFMEVRRRVHSWTAEGSTLDRWDKGGYDFYVGST